MQLANNDEHQNQMLQEVDNIPDQNVGYFGLGKNKFSLIMERLEYYFQPIDYHK